MLRRALLLAPLALTASAPPALANSACTDNAAWVAAGTTVPTHAHLVYYSDSGYGRGNDAKLVATIDGKAVKTKITHVTSSPYDLLVVDIDSDRTGKLSIGFGGDDEEESATFKVSSKVSMPKDLAATTGRYHRAYQHSTVHESYDGLAIKLPAGTPAISAHVQIRRDDKAKWSDMDVPIRPDDSTKAPSIWIGELGCVSNYTPALLEAGVDVQVVVTLADGTKREVGGLKDHVVLAAAPNAPKSRP